MSWEVFDIEALRNKDAYYRPYILLWSSGDSIYFYKSRALSAEELIMHILTNFNNSYVYYAHNLLFDFIILLPALIGLGIDYDWVFNENGLYKVVLKVGLKKITLKCSNKLIPLSLEKAAALFGVGAKLKFPYDLLDISNIDLELCIQKYPYLPRPTITLDDYLLIYAKNDILILRKILKNFINCLSTNKIDFSLKHNSISSISLSLYLKAFSKADLRLSAADDSAIRPAYHGGRCEIFGNSYANETILHYDFTGMYQSCMLSNIPLGPWHMVQGVSSCEEPGFYMIDYWSDMSMPVLPESNLRLLFTNGHKSGLFWFEEIKLFLEMGGLITRVHYALFPAKYGPFFSDFIQHLGSLRSLSVDQNFIGKLLINSFYGRLGLRANIKNYRPIKDLHGMGDLHKHLLNYNLLPYYHNHRRPISNVGAAAVISSLARIKLYRGFLDVMSAGGRILYCDTDSIFAAFKEIDNIIDKDIGSLRFNSSLKDTIINDAVFALPKTYALRLGNGLEIIKIKGVRLPNISYDEFRNAFYSDHSDLSSKKLCFKYDGMSLSGLSYMYTAKLRHISLSSYTKRRWRYGKRLTSPIWRDDINKKF